MTRKPKKRKHKTRAKRTTTIDRLFAAIEDDLLSLAEEKTTPEARWNRPRKQRVSLRMDREVVEWFKAKGPGYQTRINRILRSVMEDGKNRERK